LAAILVEETSVAKYVLEVLSKGKINAQEVFEDEMNFNAASFM